MTKLSAEFNLFNSIGSKIGLLFQIADDLIDYSGSTKKAGKKTRKDSKKGKATLISLLGYKNTVKYADKVKLDIINKIKKFGNKTKDLTDTINYILIRFLMVEQNLKLYFLLSLNSFYLKDLLQNI